MRLASLTYSEFAQTNAQWTLEPFNLQKVNLLVGRNATGKTRTLNVIASLGQILAGDRKEVLTEGSFDATFSNGNEPLHYVLHHANSIVTREELTSGTRKLLRRTQGDYGRIWNQEAEKDLRFEVSSKEVAAFAKRDSLQHPFLEPLYGWGSCVRHFEFGKTMGHSNFGIPVKGPVTPLSEKDTTQVVPIYSAGFKAFGDVFKTAVIQDMAALDYRLENIVLRRPPHLVVEPPIPLEFVGIAVKEADLPGTTDQLTMSQGMFRALSIITQLNFSVMSGRAACIIVDDIGEGLDFERSCQLIELLRQKCHASDVQLIMSTNDRFVMNRVPLEEWCYLIRKGTNVRVLNYENCKAAFERFKVTGLNNFDMLATNFLEKLTDNGKNCDLRGGADGRGIHQGTGTPDRQ
jgi:hypothetical protein